MTELMGGKRAPHLVGRSTTEREGVGSKISPWRSRGGVPPGKPRSGDAHARMVWRPAPHGAVGLVDGAVGIGRRAGVGIGDGDAAETRPPDDVGLLLQGKDRLPKGVPFRRIAVGPAVDGDGGDVPGRIETALGRARGRAGRGSRARRSRTRWPAAPPARRGSALPPAGPERRACGSCAPGSAPRGTARWRSRRCRPASSAGMRCGSRPAR